MRIEEIVIRTEHGLIEEFPDDEQALIEEARKIQPKSRA